MRRTRLLALHLRARHLPAALTVAVAVVATLGWLGRVLDGAAALPLGGLAVTAAVVTAGPGLAGADPELERTTALPWPRWRAAHLVAAGAVVAGAVLVATETWPPGRVLRDTAGAVGLLALGAMALGAARSWVAPLTWTVTAWTLTTAWPPPAGATHQALLTWMYQPTGSTPAELAAWTLATTGALAYITRGADH